MAELFNKERKPRWHDRGIGAFCGGVLGVFLAGMLAILIGTEGTASLAVLLVAGLAVGVLGGYFLPSVTETVFWVLSIFA